MKELNKSTVIKKNLPIKFLQFGEGNFLRAFVDWMIQKANNELNLNMGGVIVQPLEYGMVDKLNEQDNTYHVILEGIKGGKAIRETQRIECVQDAVNPYAEYQKYKQYFLLPELEFIFSNTTEAGIAKVENEDIFAEPPASFPGKIVALLLERFEKYDGAVDKGLIFICCELIENNASRLHEIVIEIAKENKLGDEFLTWINSSCSFCNSLVDRIVSGFPKDKISEIQQELGFEDNMVVTAEYFHLWAIEGSQRVKEQLPLHKAGLNVLWLDDLKPFRDKKVRVLNGAHTALVPIGLLAGCQTVKEAFSNESIEKFIRNLIAQEVLPNIAGEKHELQAFANEILERFFNPFIKHYLKDISLNSISKWITRDYPSLIDFYNREGVLPQRLCFSLATLILLYCDGNKMGFTLNDTNSNVSVMIDIWNSDASLENQITQILAYEALWGNNLAEIKGLAEIISLNIRQIQLKGILTALKELER